MAPLGWPRRTASNVRQCERLRECEQHHVDWRYWYPPRPLGITAAVAFIASAALTSPIPSLIAIFLATGLVWGTVAPFWTFPAFLLRGTAAAAGIAFVNSVGAVGGFTGPYIMGLASYLTNSFRAALFATGVLLIFAALIALRLKAPPRWAAPGRNS